MHWIMYHALVLALAVTTHSEAIPQDTVYNVWNDNGIHLIMSDNGTPNDYSDDWIVDYEDNRTIKVTILDN